jgi:hypothetical protein
VDVQYRVDGATSWNSITDTFDSSPSQEIDLTSDNSVSGKWIELRLILRTTDNTATPQVLATDTESLLRQSVKHQYPITFRLEDNGVDKRGTPTGQTVAAQLAQLDAWVNAKLPLSMDCVLAPYDNKVVFPEPVPLKIIKWLELDGGRMAAICQMTLIDIASAE